MTVWDVNQVARIRSAAAVGHHPSECNPGNSPLPLGGGIPPGGIPIVPRTIDQIQERARLAVLVFQAQHIYRFRHDGKTSGWYTLDGRDESGQHP